MHKQSDNWCHAYCKRYLCLLLSVEKADDALHQIFIFSSFVFVAETLSELRENLKEVIEVLTRTEGSVTSISSGCELFLRFITLASLDNPVCFNCQSIQSLSHKWTKVLYQDCLCHFVNFCVSMLNISLKEIISNNTKSFPVK